MKTRLLLFLLLIAPILSFSQTTTVKGTVLDEKGEPIPYARVRFSGTKIGTLTDTVGAFFLQSYYATDSIQVQFIGFKTTTVKIKKDEEQNIQSLNQIFEVLEEFGEKFFKDFENFPHPFDKIKPNNFINNTRVLVLDKYFIYNEFNFIWALKEINLKIDNLEKAKEFSKIGIEKATKYFQKIINDTKSKKQKELNNQFLETLVKKLKIE